MSEGQGPRSQDLTSRVCRVSGVPQPLGQGESGAVPDGAGAGAGAPRVGPGRAGPARRQRHRLRPVGLRRAKAPRRQVRLPREGRGRGPGAREVRGVPRRVVEAPAAPEGPGR